MPTVQQIHIVGLEPLIFAFDGQAGKSRETHVLDGERDSQLFSSNISDGRDNGFPKQFHKHLYVSDDEITKYNLHRGGSYPLKCFLWVIDDISIKIIWEMTPNIERKTMVPDKPYVCHTNITGENGQAYIGGEMYFCENGEIFVNFSSGRFGIVASETKKQMAIKYIEDCKFKNIKRIDYEL